MNIGHNQRRIREGHGSSESRTLEPRAHSPEGASGRSQVATAKTRRMDFRHLCVSPRRGRVGLSVLFMAR